MGGSRRIAALRPFYGLTEDIVICAYVHALVSAARAVAHSWWADRRPAERRAEGGGRSLGRAVG